MIHFNKINRDNLQHLKKSLKANSDIACETLPLPTVHKLRHVNYTHLESLSRAEHGFTL